MSEAIEYLGVIKVDSKIVADNHSDMDHKELPGVFDILLHGARALGTLASTGNGSDKVGVVDRSSGSTSDGTAVGAGVASGPAF